MNQMECFQYLLQPGSTDAGCCEKSVDTLLAIPRCFWMGKSVSIQNSVGSLDVTYQGEGCVYASNGNENLYKNAYKKEYRREVDMLLEQNRNPNVQYETMIGANGDATCAFILCGPIIAPIVALAYLPPILLSLIGMPFKATILCCDEKADLYSKIAYSYMKKENLSIKKSVLEEMLNNNQKLYEKFNKSNEKAPLKDKQDINAYDKSSKNTAFLQKELLNVTLKLTKLEERIQEEQNHYLRLTGNVVTT